MFETLKNIIATVLEDDSLRETLTMESDLINDVELDSLQMITFILGVEDAFGVEIVYEDLDLACLRSIGAFMTFLKGMNQEVG
ncbi:acyl carrier protein [Paenibacillus xylanexedens]|uniref:acyl carrier protein n=1 Tax=Paenibacillus xylanexedens TaxID=528191 RepID=UPI001F3894EC|nr:phosphopantetheine-binding protein [Paenibacillus xylanexedens]MCF7754090.1 acyl carrier protein [Paenibacillus xylanexedens]